MRSNSDCVCPFTILNGIWVYHDQELEEWWEFDTSPPDPVRQIAQEDNSLFEM